jgi:hypothetical protein
MGLPWFGAGALWQIQRCPISLVEVEDMNIIFAFTVIGVATEENELAVDMRQCMTLSW